MRRTHLVMSILIVLAAILSGCSGGTSATSGAETEASSTSISVTLNNSCDYLDGCVLKAEAQNVTVKLKSGPVASLNVHIYCIETGDGQSYDYADWQTHLTVKKVGDPKHAKLLDSAEYASCYQNSSTPEVWLNAKLVAGTYGLEAEGQALPVTITVVPGDFAAATSTTPKITSTTVP